MPDGRSGHGRARQVHETAGETAAGWGRCQAEAQTWLPRAALLNGERAIQPADDGQVADVRVSYATTMGIRRPETATCAIPLALTWDSPVLARARQAHRAALKAAARHAAATAAVRMVDDEVRTTRYRLRAVKDRWIPSLEQTLAQVTFTIEGWSAPTSPGSASPRGQPVPSRAGGTPVHVAPERQPGV